MCGISGILNFSDNQIDASKLHKMNTVLEHRGPDAAGIFIDKNIGLAHRRLSIIDTSSAGNQPFYSKNNNLVLVFNGEIYNYKSFYSELKSNEITLQSGSDTEVLLHLYELYGLKMLPRLQGMFAFAIWNKSTQELVLVRDRMGVKPLYYSIFNDELYFGSEQKALFAAGVPLKIDNEGILEYFYNRFVAGENTLFENVKKILPGHYGVFSKNGEHKTTKWWDLKYEIENYPKINEPEKWFEENFSNSVSLRMVADVPVGVLLSGGLDSSAILAQLKQLNFENIQTFTIGFSEKKHDESVLAENLSNQYNYSYNNIVVEDELLFENLKKVTYFQDEPLMHVNEPHLLAISQLANKKVKVLLSGEGADELMGGYVRYKTLKNISILQAVSYLSGFENLIKNPRINKLFRYSNIKNPDDLIIFNGSNTFPNDINKFYQKNEIPQNKYRYEILKQAKSLYPNDLQRQALYFDQHTYMCSLLDRNDRCTMGASIECREPFLDTNLITGLGTLPNNWLFKGKKGKFILKNNMQNKLPKEIINFKKIGLSSPWGKYFNTNPFLISELENFKKSAIFEMPFLENLNPNEIVAEINKGNNQIIPFVLPIFMLHIWYENYFKKFV